MDKYDWQIGDIVRLGEHEWYIKAFPDEARKHIHLTKGKGIHFMEIKQARTNKLEWLRRPTL